MDNNSYLVDANNHTLKAYKMKKKKDKRNLKCHSCFAEENTIIHTNSALKSI